MAGSTRGCSTATEGEECCGGALLSPVLVDRDLGQQCNTQFTGLQRSDALFVS